MKERVGCSLQGYTRAPVQLPSSTLRLSSIDRRHSIERKQVPRIAGDGVAAGEADAADANGARAELDEDRLLRTRLWMTHY